MRKEFQWPLIYFGTFMTFVVFPLIASKYQELIGSPGQTRTLAGIASLLIAVIYGWAMLSLVQSKRLSNSTLRIISGFALLVFFVGQTFSVVPQDQWTVSMFSLACGILCAGSVLELFRGQKMPADATEKSPESPDSH